jgi:hypothetical protein
MSAVRIEPVRKSIRVRAPLAHSFDVFANGLARWWPQDHGIARKPVDKMVLEPRLGGRWIEISKDGSRTPVATVTVWEPPHRLTLLWQVSSQWLPDAAMRSEVDIHFSADGPDTTVVELLHEAAIASAMPRAHQVFDELSRLLADQPYFAGNAFSLADVVVGAQLDMLSQVPEWAPLTAANPNLVSWLRRVTARPSFVATTWERVAAMARAQAA